MGVMMLIGFSAVVFSYVEPARDAIWTTRLTAPSPDGAVMFRVKLVRLPLVVVGFAALGRPPATFAPVRCHRTVYRTGPAGPTLIVLLLGLTWLGAEAFGRV